MVNSFWVYYLGPNFVDKKETHLFSQLEMAGRQGNVIIMGNFNYPEIDWADGTAHSTKVCHFLNAMLESFMSQMAEA